MKNKLLGKFTDEGYQYKAKIDFTKIKTKADFSRAIGKVIKEKKLKDKWIKN